MSIKRIAGYNKYDADDLLENIDENDPIMDNSEYVTTKEVMGETAEMMAEFGDICQGEDCHSELLATMGLDQEP